MNFTSLYIHIPFCVHRCGYCDFNTYASIQGLIPAYTQALCRELEFISSTAGDAIPIHSIYFGGGTPSLLSADQLEIILQTIKQNYACTTSAEVTLEANPGTVSPEYFQALAALGVNRLSLGMQSAQAPELALLERQHTFMDVVRAVEWAREAGIENLNLDLIFGLPNQELKSWMASLEEAISLGPEHLSLYALTLEHGTPLQHKVDAGILPEPDGDLAADMYEAARDRLKRAGYIHYEISNWARDHADGASFSCLHNLQYWRTLPYLGVGAGAHGFIDHHRTVNVASPRAYISRMDHANGTGVNNHEFPQTPASIQLTWIDRDTEIGEAMMMGLRLLIEGIGNEEFQARYGISLRQKFAPQIERLISLDLLEWSGAKEARLRLTERGQLLGNQVFKEFI